MNQNEVCFNKDNDHTINDYYLLAHSIWFVKALTIKIY
jgi:hypothetical protein